MFFIRFVAILNIFRIGQLIVQHCWLTCFEGKAGSGRKKAYFFPQEDLNLIFFSLIPFPFFILSQPCILFKLRMKSLLSQGLNLLYLIKITHFLNHKHDPRKSLVSTSWYATSAVISSGTSPPSRLFMWLFVLLENQELRRKPRFPCWKTLNSELLVSRLLQEMGTKTNLQSGFSAGVELLLWIQDV